MDWKVSNDIIDQQWLKFGEEVCDLYHRMLDAHTIIQNNYGRKPANLVHRLADRMFGIKSIMDESVITYYHRVRNHKEVKFPGTDRNMTQVFYGIKTYQTQVDHVHRKKSPLPKELTPEESIFICNCLDDYEKMLVEIDHNIDFYFPRPQLEKCREIYDELRPQLLNWIELISNDFLL
jgi:hypothetical protein